MLRTLKNSATFFREFRQRFQTTGSIAPSSRFLASAMTRYLKQRGDEPVRVLEVGPGTGAFTTSIIRQLKPGDTFDLVELNEAFVEVLNNRFATEETWKAAAPFSQVHPVPLQEFNPPENYDFIISGLPHVNFPSDLVKSIMDRYFELLKPDGKLSYFEYMFIRPIRGVITPGAEGKRIAEINDIVRSRFTSDRIRRDSVFLNIPPAWSQHFMSGSPGQGDGVAD